MTTTAPHLVVRGYWHRVNGCWSWIKPYRRYTDGACETLPTIDASPDCGPAGPGDLAPETLVEFGRMLTAERVWEIDLSGAFDTPESGVGTAS
jgi:hypothetical protein